MEGAFLLNKMRFNQCNQLGLRKGECRLVRIRAISSFQKGLRTRREYCQVSIMTSSSINRQLCQEALIGKIWLRLTGKSNLERLRRMRKGQERITSWGYQASKARLVQEERVNKSTQNLQIETILMRKEFKNIKKDMRTARMVKIMKKTKSLILKITLNFKNTTKDLEPNTTKQDQRL
jgi:hypothetical protein